MKAIASSVSILVLSVLVIVSIFVFSSAILSTLESTSSQGYYDLVTNIDMKLSRVRDDKVILVLYAKKPVANISVRVYCIKSNVSKLIFSREIGNMVEYEEKHYVISTPVNSTCYGILMDERRTLLKIYEN